MNEAGTPAPVRQISVHELKAMREQGLPMQLLDVRTTEERAIASIAGARHLTQELATELQDLDRGTLLVFQCHHGMRSQRAAMQFAALGFTNLCNLSGGIDAWSLSIDPSVRRY
jgi:monothiol glutaredoxin